MADPSRCQRAGSGEFANRRARFECCDHCRVAIADAFAHLAACLVQFGTEAAEVV